MATNTYAAQRWARAVTAVLTSRDDLRTVPAWARTHGVSPGTIREYCRLAGVSSKASLDFARMLRAVLAAQDGGWDPQNALNVSEARTLRRLLAGSGLPAHSQSAPDVQRFLAEQRFVRDPRCLAVIAALIDRAPSAAAGFSGSFSGTSSGNP